MLTSLVPVCVSMMSLALGDSGPAITIRSMDGKLVTGTLVQMGSETIVFRADDSVEGTSETFRMDQVHQLRFGEPAPWAASAVRVLEVDGSVLLAEQLTVQTGQVSLVLKGDRKVSLPIDAIAGIVFAEIQPGLFQQWKEQNLPARLTDALTVQRDDKMHTLEGIIGDIDSEQVVFVLDGDQIPVKRTRLHSLAFSHEESPLVPKAMVQDRWGNQWVAKNLSISNTTVEIESNFLKAISLERVDVESIDFGAGRIVFVSDLEPTVEQHVPFFDEPWQVCRDRNQWGEKLQVADRVYTKGLALHSKTTLEFETGGKFQRFEAEIGIDKSAGVYGDAQLRIVGDSKVLHESRVRAGMPAVPVAISLANVQFLQIEVDFGEFLDLGDWVVLGDARLVR